MGQKAMVAMELVLPVVVLVVEGLEESQLVVVGLFIIWIVCEKIYLIKVHYF